MFPSNINVAQVVRVILLIIATLLVAYLFSPFAHAALLAAVLAATLQPLCDRLQAWLWGRRNVAAGILTVGVLLLLVLPISVIVTAVVKEVIAGVHYIQAIVQSQGIVGLLGLLPLSLRHLAERLLDGLQRLDINFAQLFPAASGQKAAAALGGAVSATTRLVVDVVFMLIALFFFLCDGRKLVAWIENVFPLPQTQVKELLSDFRRVSVSVLLSAVVTAAVQASVALVGYLIAQVPHPLFFGFVSFVAAFVPIGGAALVGLFLALLMWATGHTGAAIFLAAWSVGVVSLVDNIVKPLFVRSSIPIHGAVIFFSFLGGMTMFGLVGLIVGPLIVSFFLALVRMFRHGTPVVSTE